MPTARLQDYRAVRALAAASLLVLLALGLLYALVPSATAPRVHVRWAATVGDGQRGDLERQLTLLAGEHREGTTWAYDLADPSPAGIAAIVTHPLVADTHHIDRARRAVAADAPSGTTRIRGGLSVWRDAQVAGWLARVAFFCLVLSIIWLGTSGRPVARGTRRERRSIGGV